MTNIDALDTFERSLESVQSRAALLEGKTKMLVENLLSDLSHGLARPECEINFENSMLDGLFRCSDHVLIEFCNAYSKSSEEDRLKIIGAMLGDNTDGMDLPPEILEILLQAFEETVVRVEIGIGKNEAISRGIDALLDGAENEPGAPPVKGDEGIIIH